MRSALLAALLALGVFADSSPGGPPSGSEHGGGEVGDDAAGGAAVASSTAPAATATPSASSGNGTSSVGLKGDTQCSDLMCVNAIVDGNTVTYELQASASASQPMTWMAMGFGKSMYPNNPMVIMWPNSTGGITLSQRTATGYSEPQVQASPPRIATVDIPKSSLTGKTPTLAYTIPANSDTTQDVMWAYGYVPVQGNIDSPSATLQQHLESGILTLDLTKTITSDTPTSTAPVTSGQGPLKPYQKMIIAHAILMVVGFLFVLPLGGLLARWFRTVTPKWFTGHWFIQGVIGGPIIIAAWILGMVQVRIAKAPQVDTQHKKLGVALGGVYITQVCIGATIHFFKDPNRKRRPIQNYFHALVGLTITGLAFYQVHLGFHDEWPRATGRGPIAHGAAVVWTVWVVFIPVLYFAGLVFIPKQYKQEAQNRQKVNSLYDDEAVSMVATRYRDDPTEEHHR